MENVTLRNISLRNTQTDDYNFNYQYDSEKFTSAKYNITITGIDVSTY